MATVAHAFSPKEWKVGIVSDATNAGATGIGSTMNQLDVDSIGFPTLNVNQKLDVRSGASRTFKDEDFFQENALRAVEISLSGTLHVDAGHKLLAQNIANDVSGDIAVATGFTAASQKYGAAVTNAASSLTLVMQPSDTTHQQALEFFGCVVTSFSITAEAGTDGGQYKWSATLMTGKKPDLASTASPTITAYGNSTTIPKLSGSSGHKVFNTDVIMSSFTTAIESPAIFTGVASDGFEVVSRGAEIAVTAEAQVKYDGNTKGFINSFDTQTAALSGNMLVITNDANFGVDIQNGVFTDVALSEGDLMMLDCSIKSVDDGSDALVTFDIS